MGTQRVVLTNVGKNELCISVFVPDRQGFESIDRHRLRIIQYLNERYGLNKWHDPETTIACKRTTNALQLAEQTQGKFGQLDTIRRQAKNREKKLEKLLKSTR